jgi:hypothetical protein
MCSTLYLSVLWSIQVGFWVIKLLVYVGCWLELSSTHQGQRPQHVLLPKCSTLPRAPASDM